MPYAIGGGDELEVFPDGERVEELGVVGDVGQQALGGDGFGGDIVAADEKLAAGGGDGAGDSPHGGCLAGAVGTEEPEDLAGLHVEAQAGDGGGSAIGFVKVCDLD